MEGEGRARRATAGTTRGGQKAKGALAALAELRKGGGKSGQLDRFELKEEEAVYDVVDEQSYAQLVQKRREEGGAPPGPPPPPPPASHLSPAAALLPPPSRLPGRPCRRLCGG